MATILEETIGIVTILVEIAAIFVTLYAKRKMSNPHLGSYMNYMVWAIAGAAFFSIWHTAIEMFELQNTFGIIIEVPEHLGVLIANVMFLLGALAIYKMSREYGFRSQKERMASIIRKNRQAK